MLKGRPHNSDITSHSSLSHRPSTSDLHADKRMLGAMFSTLSRTNFKILHARAWSDLSGITLGLSPLLPALRAAFPLVASPPLADS